MLKTYMFKYGVKEVVQRAREQLYLAHRMDVTKPLDIRGKINERCNYRCSMCMYWRLEKYSDEMSIEEWRRALLSLKSFLGEYVIRFSGGEPFIKKGFVGLLNFCAENRIQASVITNGSCFTRNMAGQTVSARPLTVDISVDGPTPEVHDLARGVPGSLREIERGIGALLEEQGRQGVEFPIRIRSTIHALNFRTMPQMVDWAARIGAASIGFEPLRHWTDESKGVLWPQEADMDALESAIAEVLEMKRSGAAIETSERRLSRFAAHFRGENVAPMLATCRTGLRNFHIRCDGKVTVCDQFPLIGDVKRQTAREIWHGPEARRIRSETVACGKGCAYGCLAHRSLRENLQRGLLVLRQS